MTGPVWRLDAAYAEVPQSPGALIMGYDKDGVFLGALAARLSHRCGRPGTAESSKEMWYSETIRPSRPR